MKYCPYCMSELTEGNGICPQCGKNTEEYKHPAHTLKQGALLNNRYLIGGVIGEGGFGITYIGLDTLLQYRVAVKEFFPNGMVNRNNTVSNDVLSISTESAKELFSKSRENFLREARTLAKFNNEPGIVAVKDFFEENHTVYIVMEYLEGITLKSYLSQVEKISPYNTVCLLMPVFRSLKKIHEKRLIHRDISPDNIMLVGEDVKLLDFGAAREFADERSLSVMLKHGYAPMEQYRRHGIQGAWTDVYAICATMYRCITGTVPPDAPDRVFEDELKMPSELGVEIEPDFEKVLRHGLAIKPDERIQSIDELIEELGTVPGIDIGEKSSNIEAPLPKKADTRQDNEKTILPPSDNELRLSEYVPHYVEEEEKPKSNPSESSESEKNEEPDTSVSEEAGKNKTKSKMPFIIGIVVVLILAAGITAAIVFTGGNKQEEPQESSAAAIIQKSESSHDESKSESISESSVQNSKTESKTESSAVESKTESKTQSSAEESKTESKTESSADESKTESSNSTSQVSESSEVIEFPDLKNNFEIEDGLLQMLYSLFGKGIEETADLFEGTLYWSKEHPIYGDEYIMLNIPIKTPRYSADYIDSIDLFYKDNKLVGVEYSYPGEFDNEIAKTARAVFGEPANEEKEDILWKIGDRDIYFTLCMTEYPRSDGTKYKCFTQKYFTGDAAMG